MLPLSILWDWNSTTRLLVKLGSTEESETYASYHHNTVVQYIATRPIMDICLAAKRRPGTRVEMRWWEQDDLDLEGMKTAAWEAEQT